VKLDFDFSKGIVLDSRNKLAFHIGVGVGMAYGNSNYLPFERKKFRSIFQVQIQADIPRLKSERSRAVNFHTTRT